LKKNIFILLGVVFSLLTTSYIAFAQVFWLHVEGNKIKDESGKVVILRGANLEGREWDCDGRCIDYEKKAIPVLTGAPPTGWGANVILIAVASGPINRGDHLYLGALDQITDLAKQNNAYTLMAYRYAEPNIFQPTMPDQAAEDALAKLAERYKNEPAVLYGLQVEPHDVSWSALKPRFTSMVDAIRANNPRALIFVPGTDWSRYVYHALSDPIPRDNLVYKSHTYDSLSNIFNNYRLEEVAEKYSVIIGEFGWDEWSLISSVENVAQLLDYVEDIGIGWIAWLFQSHGCPCLLKSTSTFEPTQYGAEIKSRLQASVSTPPLTPKPTGSSGCFIDILVQRIGIR
jgi:hypothetical protein